MRPVFPFSALVGQDALQQALRLDRDLGEFEDVLVTMLGCAIHDVVQVRDG